MTLYESFLNKSLLAHGDRYDYSLIEYVDNKTKVKIICKKHGIFEQIPYAHYRLSQNCPKCVNNNINLLRIPYYKDI